MENNWNNNPNVIDYTQESAIMPKTFVSNVMVLMSLGLLISAALAYMFGNSAELFGMLYNLETGGRTGLGWIVMLAPLGLVLGLGAGLQRFSSNTLILLFLVFAALMGMSLSSIFVVYSASSITLTFLIAAGMFGTMAVAGYVTNTDLSKMGSILFMGLIGIIIASVVNWFLGSAQLDYIISFLGVLIFTGLTAYDMQKIKQMGMTVGHQGELARKMAVMGALSLYLDFINLFLFLLRFFGNRD
ncbi:MAG: Bax inhibitor-1/YccA family protein [Schleiferiaceae bacterium]|jgi:FtsH-binding integral membrane protein|nr:Bax inhibitor-1/YccA family protein [Schleiferiaceae bacterium]